MTRDACMTGLRQDLAGLTGDRAEIFSGYRSRPGDGRAVQSGESGRKRCWREFAGAVHAILEETPHDA